MNRMQTQFLFGFIWITLLKPSSVETCDVDIDVRLGNTAQFPCHCDIQLPLYSVELKKGNELLLLHDRDRGSVVNLNPATYSVDESLTYVNATNIAISNEGQYKCESSNSVDFNVELLSINLFVYELPSVVTITSGRARILAGTSETVTCEAAPLHPSGTLTFHIISENNTLGGSLVRSENVQTNDDGTLTVIQYYGIIFQPEYNVHKLRCKVEFNFRTQNKTVISSELGVIVEYKPGKPRDLRLESVSFRVIVISFLPGHDNGYQQSITVLYKALSDNSYTQLDYANDDPVLGVRHEITINGTDIRHTTTYIIQIQANNAYPVGSATLSDPFTVTTRDEVLVDTEMMTLQRINDQLILSWAEPNGYYSALFIEQCDEEDACNSYNVTGLLQKRFDVTDGANFTLVVYQDRDVVTRITFNSRNEKEKEKDLFSSESSKSPTGVIIGSVLAAFVIVVVIVISIVLLYKKRQSGEGNQENPYTVPEPQPQDITRTTYIELTAKDKSTTKSRDSDNPYEAPVDTESVPSAFGNVFNLKEFSEKRLICKGAYAAVYKGVFRNKVCAVKILNDNSCKVIDLKWLMSQIKALQSTGYHEHLLNLVASNTSIDHVAMVTHLETYGDLKTYLNKGGPCMQYANPPGEAKEIMQHINFGKQIVDGMLFLRQQMEMDILCYQLSAINILVGEGFTCKITHFACAEDVKERQKHCIASQEKDESIVPWLAPECLQSVDEHTTASDVWSFGVLLYEMATNGADPYPNLDLNEIGPFVLKGKIMPAPTSSDHLYGIMVQCWRYDPIKRPSWLTLRDFFQALCKQYGEATTEYEIIDS